MAVHYKFNAAKEFDTLPVDGLHISLADLKEAIIHHKRLGKGDVCDLQITNAETKETYKDEKALIPKNSSLIIARVPIDPSQRKMGDLGRTDKELLLSNPEYRMNTEGSEEAEALSRRLEEVPDLTKFAGTEEEKISAMIAQSTIDYHPSRYLKLRNTVMSGKVPPFYKCYKCHQGGHWVSNCPLNNQDLRKCSGIPSKFLVEVEDHSTPGVMITPTGKYVVLRQNLGVSDDPKEKVALVRPTGPTPPELKCLLCSEIMVDAVLIPCCANAYCDECIRNHLLESEDHTCPTCCSSDIGPDTLIPNRYLRLKIANFGNLFLTELPKSFENGEIDESSSNTILGAASRSGSPAYTSGPTFEAISSGRQSDSNTPVRPNSPPVLNDVLALEEEERANALKAIKHLASDDTDGNDIAQSNLSLKEKKRLKKAAKKKKEGAVDKEKERKHKKKDKEKKKKKKDKKKEEKERKSQSEGDPGSDSDRLNHSTEELGSGSEPHSGQSTADTLMNEALIYRYNPIVPPPHPPPAVHPIRLMPPIHYRGPILVRPIMRPVLHPHYQQIGPVPIQRHHSPYINGPPEDDILSTFEAYLRQKDEQKKRKLRSSSRSPYRSPRSPSRSPQHKDESSYRNRKGARSPRSRRNYSPSNSRQNHRSRSHSRSPTHHHFKDSPSLSSHYHSSSDVNSPYRSEKYQSRDKIDDRQISEHHSHKSEPENYDDVPSRLQMGRGRVGIYTRDSRENERSFHHGREYPYYSKREIGSRKEDLKKRLEDRRGLEDSKQHQYNRHRDGHLSSDLETNSKRRHDEEARSKHSSSRYDNRRSRGSPTSDSKDSRRKDDDYEEPKERSRSARRSNKETDQEAAEEKFKVSSVNKDSRSNRSPKKDSELKSSKESRGKDKNASGNNLDKTNKEDSKENKDEVRNNKMKEGIEEVEGTDKKKQEKKKKKKDKRKHSEISENEAIEDKKLKKKEKKIRKLEKIEKVQLAAESESPSISAQDKRDPVSNPYLSVVSKWDNEDMDEGSTHSSAIDRIAPQESNLVTSDVIKRAENALFGKLISGRSIPKKSTVNDKLKNKDSEIKKDRRSSSPEWEGVDSRETRKRGSSIQITISSKNEAQIGRHKLVSKSSKVEPVKSESVESIPKSDDRKKEQLKLSDSPVKGNDDIQDNVVGKQISSPSKEDIGNSDSNDPKSTVVNESESQINRVISVDDASKDVNELPITFSPGGNSLLESPLQSKDNSLSAPCSAEVMETIGDHPPAQTELEEGELMENELVKNEDSNRNLIGVDTEKSGSTEQEKVPFELNTDGGVASSSIEEKPLLMSPPPMIFGGRNALTADNQITAKKKKKKRTRSSSSSSTTSTSSSSSSSSDEGIKKKKKKKKKKSKKKSKKRKHNKEDTGGGSGGSSEKGTKKDKKKKKKKSKD